MALGSFSGIRRISARRAGFSLLEIAIAISLGAILLAIGLPMMRRAADSRNVNGLAARLQTFLNDARNTARTSGTLVISPIDGANLGQCQGLRSEVPGTDAYTGVLICENGASFSGPAITPLVVLRSGEFDITQPAYFAITGSHPDNVAFVTFNATGGTSVTSARPAAQMAASSVGLLTSKVISVVGTSAGTSSSGGTTTSTLPASTAYSRLDLSGNGLAVPLPTPNLSGGTTTGGGIKVY